MMIKKYRITEKNKFKYKNFETDETSLCEKKKEAIKKLEENSLKLYELQQKFYAEKKEGLIIVFQAMDAAGKDGTIREVLKALAPQGVYEKAFKAPTSEELAHDFLWRIHSATPRKGEIAIFNRSHYEDVLIGKVKSLYKNSIHSDWVKEDEIIDNRYEDIKNFETYLYNNSIKVIKIFLNVSKKEQAERFLSRIEEPEKNWKFSGSDFEERQFFEEYQKAFEDAINKTSTKEAPWYVVPADHKWYLRYIVSEIILDTLEELDPKYPVVTKERLETFERYRQEILNEYK